MFFYRNISLSVDCIHSTEKTCQEHGNKGAEGVEEVAEAASRVAHRRSRRLPTAHLSRTQTLSVAICGDCLLRGNF